MIPQAALDAVSHYLAPQHWLTKDIAVALVSVFYAGESALNPGPQANGATDRGGVLNPHGAFGIMSLNGQRQQALADFAKAKGLDSGLVATQLDFALTEIANSYPQLRDAIWPNGLGRPPGAISYKDLIPMIVDVYENPANHQAEIDKSLAFAATLYPAVPTAAPAAAAAVPAASAAPVPAAAPTALPTPTQGLAMEAVIAALEPAIAPIVAPLVESLIAGLARGLLSQVLAQVPAPVGTAATAGVNNLPATLEEIAAEVAKLLQAKPAA